MIEWGGVIGGWERCSQSLGRGGEGGSFVAWLQEGTLSLSLSLFLSISLSFSACLPALKGVMESGERRIRRLHRLHRLHHHHHGV